MRILQVHTTYREPGGEDTVVSSEARLLSSAGHLVVRHEAANPHGLRSAGTLAASPWNAAAARAAVSAARVADAEIAHIHNTWFAMGPAVPCALARAGVPVVMTLHNYRRVCVNASLFREDATCTDCVGRSPWPGVRHRCYRGSFAASAAAAASIVLNQQLALPDRCIAVFLVLNKFMEEVLVRGGLPGDRVLIKGNTVADPGARPAPPSQGSAIVALGRVEALKGVDLLVDAWARVRPDRLELLVVGDGPLRRELESRRVPGVRFLGQQPAEAVRALLLGARGLAFASRLSEGQPMSVLEAMAAGLPVLASRAGGTPELLSDAGDRWLVEQGDPQSWASAVEWASAAPAEVWDSAGRALRSRWAREHSEQGAVRALEAAYLKALR